MFRRFFGGWYRYVVAVSLVLFWTVLTLYSLPAPRHESRSMSAADLLARMGSQTGYQTCKVLSLCTGMPVPCPPDSDCTILDAACTPSGMGTTQAIVWQSPQYCTFANSGFGTCSLTPIVSLLCNYKYDCTCKRNMSGKLYCSQSTTQGKDCVSKAAIGCTYMTCP